MFILALNSNAPLLPHVVIRMFSTFLFVTLFFVSIFLFSMRQCAKFVFLSLELLVLLNFFCAARIGPVYASCLLSEEFKRVFCVCVFFHLC